MRTPPVASCSHIFRPGTGVADISRFVRGALLLVLLLVCLRAHPQQHASSGATLDTLYRSGYAAFSNGDLPTAHASFARLVALAPKVAIAHTAYGEVLLAEGHPAAALRELQLAAQLDPKAPDTSIAMGQAFLQTGDAPRAAQAFARGVASGAALSAEESRAYAAALVATGQPEKAQAALTDALHPAPGQPALSAAQTALVEDALGSLLAQGGQMDQAAEHFATAIAADPELASAHAHLGAVALARQQPETALVELRRACELAPADSVYALQLGRALSASGKNADAIPVLRHTVELAAAASSLALPQREAPPVGAPTRSRSTAQSTGLAANTGKAPAQGPTVTALALQAFLEDARYALALALQAGGQPAEALPLFAGYAATHPRDSAVLVNYALALVQTGNAKQAVSLYEQALAAGPESVTLREDYGVAYLQQSDLDHALAQFQAGLRLEPENPRLHYDLGLAYKLKDNLPAAIPEFERAEALDPTLPDPPYTLGVIHMQQGDFPAAAGQLEQAVSLRPENGAAWAVLGNVYKENNQPDKAADALRKAIALQPEQPSNHVSLAALLAQAGDPAGAAAERRQAADLSRAAVSRQRSSFALKSGEALLAEGKLKEAETQLRTAVDAAPSDAAPHLALAEALDREGRSSDAALERKQAAALAGPTSSR